ncbi:Tm-1-like ATP-binding domain-containing protein [Nocardiopsis halophila]|uniref:Tm-1-like ATP-binding domain-containing protein n=1 Tax=Nocardiopsis halophila TaxID=141692 RepID=UPI00034D0524|nr:Tm-1-like ATP-binding domain-containing protein [Nocardiopsis halophila]
MSARPPVVAVLATLDTKGAEAAFVTGRLAAAGLETVLVDTGVFAPAAGPPADIAARDAADAPDAGADRGAAVAAMAEGAHAAVLALRAQGRLDGAVAVGGTGGTSIAARALRALPLGVPKVVVSTAASGDTRPYVGESDLVLMPSVVDVAGLNSVSTRVLANACDAVAGMVRGAPVERPAAGATVAASMFGVTTPAVTRARELLEERGDEVLVFHMTGTGGRALEALADAGALDGVLDLTTTELADELVGGVMSAGPGRLAGGPRTPRVISLGALDMVNFGPRESVPEHFADRRLLVHNPSVTLMRTTPEECAELGSRLAARACARPGPTAVLLPLRGVSAVAVQDGPFHDPDADAALFDAVRTGLAGSGVRVEERDTDINDPAFAEAAVAVLAELHGEE